MYIYSIRVLYVQYIHNSNTWLIYRCIVLYMLVQSVFPSILLVSVNDHSILLLLPLLKRMNSIIKQHINNITTTKLLRITKEVSCIASIYSMMTVVPYSIDTTAWGRDGRLYTCTYTYTCMRRWRMCFLLIFYVHMLLCLIDNCLLTCVEEAMPGITLSPSTVRKYWTTEINQMKAKASYRSEPPNPMRKKVCK